MVESKGVSAKNPRMKKLPVSVKTSVMVWDKSCEITVYRKSKTVWIAVGDYLGEQIETKGSTQRAAAAQWREAARYKGN
jgi:hypothetical protein